MRILIVVILMIYTISSQALADEFAVKYLTQFKKESTSSQNLVASPVSIELAFGQLSLGARGNTKTELDKVFAPRSAQDWKTFSQSLRSKEVDLLLGNNFWYQREIQIEKTFLEATKTAFDVEPEPVNFSETERVRKQINIWVSNRTNKMIPEAIKAGNITNQTKIVLANTVYFKGLWQKQFDKGQTFPQVFKNSEGKEKKVAMMRDHRKTGYFENDHFQIVGLPTRDPDYEMVFFRPKGKPLKISKEVFQMAISLTSAPQETSSIDLQIPRFEVRFRTESLKDTLIRMGLVRVFDVKTADLSGISKIPLHVNAVIHEAVVKVDESGAEAAAVTALSVRDGAIPTTPKSFVLDRPFLFAITKRSSKQILFFGEVNQL